MPVPQSPAGGGIKPSSPAAPGGGVSVPARAGAAQAIQRASAEAAGAILDPVAAAARLEAGGVAAAAGGPGEVPGAVDADGRPTGFRTPFREGDGSLFLIDQRRLPDQLVEVEVRNGPEAATAIRQMVVRGAPAIGQVAAIGLALSAERAKDNCPTRGGRSSAAARRRSGRPARPQ